jgi:hypothetical protein
MESITLDKCGADVFAAKDPFESALDGSRSGAL